MRPLLLVTFAALLAGPLAGCTLGGPAPARDTAWSEEVGSDDALRVVVAHERVNATPGARVEVPVLLACGNDAPSARVEARLVGATLEGARVSADLSRACHAALFLPLDLSADAPPGTHNLSVEVRDAAGDAGVVRRAVAAATLVVPEPAPTYARGDVAHVVYTGRFADTDELFYTNDPFVGAMPFARAAAFRQGNQTLVVREGATAGIPDGFIAALHGMQAGESRAATVPAEKAYGPVELLAREPRDERVPRDRVIEVAPEAMARPTFDAHIRETEQGEPSSFGEGDFFFITQGGNAWRYRITAADAQRVDYVFAPHVGDRYTLYPFWPRASEVTEATAERVVLRTTPTMDAGASFTMRAPWPNMTTFVRVEDDAIVVRHSPPQGLVFERAVSATASERVEVRKVTEETITLATRNAHPYAGRELVFDIRLVALEKRA